LNLVESHLLFFCNIFIKKVLTGLYFFCKNINFLGIFKEKTKALKYQHGMRHFLVHFKHFKNVFLTV
jgi:hypothetical protein